MTEAADMPYRIIEIQPDWVLEEEAMGSKKKFWFREKDGAPDWLFKHPQANTGQHWAEKIAAEVAGVLGILHARVELAMFQGVQGSTTKSFAREGRELYHGNQVLAGQLLGYDPKKQFRQSDHTLTNILDALKRVFPTPEAARTAREQLATYLVLDALIGNTDRHHENWGILRKHMSSGWQDMVAPSFDHASSLGRELRDEGKGKSRQGILTEDRLAHYAEKVPGAIYWDKMDRCGISPLELVRRAVDLYPEMVKPALKRLNRLSRDGLTPIISRVPEGWMNELFRTFAVELMDDNQSPLPPFDKGSIYMTKAQHNPADRLGCRVVGYFARLARFLGFGVCGSGGLFNSARSRSSAHFIPSSRGSRSSLSRFTSCCGLRVLLMVES